MIVLAGPTASGKTELAVSLALRLNGEVVSADSRQVYRLLDAATAKPSAEQRARVPHHLLDVADPTEAYDAGRFIREAASAIADIRRRGKTPIVCGGTGLYLRALTEGLSPLPPRDEALRARLAAQAKREGPGALHARLAKADAAAAVLIPAANVHRVIRALEVLELTGRPITEQWAAERTGGEKPAATLRLEVPAEVLRARIETRARAMWPALLSEVRALVPSRFHGDEPGFTSLGYREAVSVVKDGLPAEDGIAAMIRATHAYAKRQRTWFRHQLLDAVVVSAGRLRERLSRTRSPRCRIGRFHRGNEGKMKVIAAIFLSFFVGESLWAEIGVEPETVRSQAGNAFTSAMRKGVDEIKNNSGSVNTPDAAPKIISMASEPLKPIREFSGHTGPITHMTFSRSGQYLFTSSFDKTVRMWGIQTDEKILFPKFKGTVYSVAVDADGKNMFASDHDGIVKWDIAKGIRSTLGTSPESAVWALAASSDGKLLFSGDNEGLIRVWDTAKGAEIKRWATDGASVLGLSADGRRLFASTHAHDHDHSVTMWDSASGRALREFEMPDTPVNRGTYSIDLSPDGRYLATGNAESARIWEVATGKLIHDFPGFATFVVSIALSPDGAHLYTANQGNKVYSGMLCIWDVATGQKVYQYEFPDGIGHMTLSPDGKYLFMTGTVHVDSSSQKDQGHNFAVHMYETPKF